MQQATALRLHSAETVSKRLLGLPFLAFGLVALWALGQVGASGAGSLLALGVLGAVFTGLGSFLCFGRVETEIDRAAATVVHVVRLFVPLVVRRHSLSDAERVVLQIEVHANEPADSFDYQLYHVALQGLDPGSASLRLISEPDYASAHAHAVAAAEYLGLPLVDSTSSTANPRRTG